jgi:hypothetical protein
MLMVIILTVVGILLPIWLFQWWMYRKYGASPSVMNRLLGDDGYTARWGRKHFEDLQTRQPGEAEKRKPDYSSYAPARTQPQDDTRPRVSRLDDSNRDDDAPPVPLSELLSDEAKRDTGD